MADNNSPGNTPGNTPGTEPGTAADTAAHTAAHTAPKSATKSAPKSAPDPAVQFSEWVTQWERSVDEFSNKIMGTEEFSKSLNQMQNVQMEFQRSFGESMARQLATFNMPSRDDVIRIGEDLRDVERRLAHIERYLEKIVRHNETGATRKPEGPRRTKLPPSATAN